MNVDSAIMRLLHEGTMKTKKAMLSFEVGTYYEEGGYLFSFRAEPPCGHTLQISHPSKEIVAIKERVIDRNGSYSLNGTWACPTCGAEYKNPSAEIWMDTRRILV